MNGIKYPRAKPYISEHSKKEILNRFTKILDTGNLIQGNYVKELEDKFAKFIGTKYAVATNSCTSALEIVIKSLGITNKKILVPSQTFVASGNAVILSGNTPVFTDINKDTLCMSFKSIQENMSKDVAAIMLVHMGGLITPEYYEIKSYCDKHNIILIEDAAHAHGSKIDNLSAGNLGEAGCFSFYPTKLMTTGEGGMITTNNKELADKAKLYRNHGGDGRNFTYNSSNYRMTELNAAIGLSQLEELPYFIKARNTIANNYIEGLKNVKHITLLPTYDHIKNSYWNFYFVLNKEFSREKFVNYLLEKGIQTGDAYTPSCHQQKAFEKYIGDQDFSAIEDVLQRHVSLPMYVGMTTEDIDYIINAITSL